MPFSKSAIPSGKKQAPMPGPDSAAYKKIVAARKNAAAQSATSNGAKKPPKTPLFSTLKSRQLTVERIKREIWAAVQEINQAIINLALCVAGTAASKSLPAAPLNPVDAFFKSLGIDPAGDEPEPDMAA